MAKVVTLRPVEHTVPGNILRKVPIRPKNKDVRTREYLTAIEIEMIIKAAGNQGRHRRRDRVLLLTAYRHGLRVSELIDLRWCQINMQSAEMHVNRIKNGTASVQPIEGDEMRLLRRLRKDYPDTPFVFATERRGPLCRSTVSKIMTRAGIKAKLAFPVHPHMLRHSTGYYLANNGVPTRTIQAYLGHKSIQHTVRYTELSSSAFTGLWK